MAVVAACSTVADATGGSSDSAASTNTAVGTTAEDDDAPTTGYDPQATSIASDSPGGTTGFATGTASMGESTTFPDPGPSEGTTMAGEVGTDGPEATTDTDTNTGTDTGGTTGPGCIPSPEVCNDLDDDCNDQIDDLDVGMDGICDCLSIAIVGNQGYEPSSQFQAYLEEQGTSVERINSVVQNDIDAPLTPAVLDKYDIVILDWLQRNYTNEESNNVRAWVEGGAGLMTMTGHTNEQVTIDRSNSFIAPLGLTYNGSKGFFNGPVTQFAVHPITQGLTSLTFLGGLYIDIVDDADSVDTTIMTLPQGPVGVVQERKDGRVFVFGDEWVEFDSQWQNMPEIQQFWVQTLSYLGPKNSCIVPQ